VNAIEANGPALRRPPFEEVKINNNPYSARFSPARPRPTEIVTKAEPPTTTVS
jgi:hypothetical protein